VDVELSDPQPINVASENEIINNTNRRLIDLMLKLLKWLFFDFMT
jgi:hypothetical protein